MGSGDGTPTQRVAEALRQHRFDPYLFECSCQRDLPDNEVLAMDRDEHEAHVAEAAIDALQLTEELRVTEDGEQVAWPPSMKHALDIVNKPIGDAKPVIEFRLVGPWEERS